MATMEAIQSSNGSPFALRLSLGQQHPESLVSEFVMEQSGRKKDWLVDPFMPN
jgi:hypothetical protein